MIVEMNNILDQEKRERVRHRTWFRYYTIRQSARVYRCKSMRLLCNPRPRYHSVPPTRVSQDITQVSGTISVSHHRGLQKPLYPTSSHPNCYQKRIVSFGIHNMIPHTPFYCRRAWKTLVLQVQPWVSLDIIIAEQELR